MCIETAIWARFPCLPPEYYDKTALDKMGSILGYVLKIDVHTNDTLRGQYARLCIQVNINRPLKTLIHFGHHSQVVIYEGVNFVLSVVESGTKTLSVPVII